MSHTVSQLAGFLRISKLTICMLTRLRTLVLRDLVKGSDRHKENQDHQNDGYPIRKIPGNDNVVSHLRTLRYNARLAGREYQVNVKVNVY